MTKIIVNKQVNGISFRLKNARIVTLSPERDGMNFIPDVVFEELMAEYGHYIRSRIFSDKNPKGCFLMHEKEEDARAQEEEFDAKTGGSEFIDVSRQMTKKEADALSYDSLTINQLKEIGREKGIGFRENISKKKLIELLSAGEE